MDAALGWIGQIFEAIMCIFPRLLIVRATHEGVKWRHGGEAIRLAKGLHVYWPLVSQIEMVVVARQTLNLPSQVLTTSDKRSVTVGAFVVYSLDDVVKAIGEQNWDVDDTVANIAMAAVVEVVTSHTLDELLKGVSEGRKSRVARKLTVCCRSQLKQFGVAIARCGITDFAESQVYRLVGDEPIRRLTSSHH